MKNSEILHEFWSEIKPQRTIFGRNGELELSHLRLVDVTTGQALSVQEFAPIIMEPGDALTLTWHFEITEEGLEERNEEQ